MWPRFAGNTLQAPPRALSFAAGYHRIDVARSVLLWGFAVLAWLMVLHVDGSCITQSGVKVGIILQQYDDPAGRNSSCSLFSAIFVFSAFQQSKPTYRLWFAPRCAADAEAVFMEERIKEAALLAIDNVNNGGGLLPNVSRLLR